MINFEMLFQFLYNIPNKNSRPHDVVMYSFSLCLISQFSVELAPNLFQFLVYLLQYAFLVFCLSWQYFGNAKQAIIQTTASYFLFIQYRLNKSVKSPLNEQISNSELKQNVETLFDRHYQQEIGQMNVYAAFTTIIASIRINFNPEIERLVQFTRLMEQLCLEYKVSFVTVSSKTFQFFVSEEVSTIQKKFDQALQLCSGAQVIAKCLDMKVSAGVAFGEIEQVKQIFGNLQYKQYYGDAPELADFVSQHSFDEILVDATGLYDDSRKPGAGFTDPRYGQHFQEPHFAYKTELRKLDFEGETRLIAVAEPRDTMTKQLSDVLIKSGNINDISLNIVIAPSSEPTTDNKYDSDSISLTVMEKRKARYEISQIQNNCIPEIESNSIHKIAESSNVQQYQSQFKDNGFILFFQFIRRICKLSPKLNQYVITKKTIHLQSTLSDHISLIAYSVGSLLLFKVNDWVDHETKIVNQFGVHILTGQITLKQWINIQVFSYILDIILKVMCTFLFIFTNKYKQTKSSQLFIVSQKIDSVILMIHFFSNCQKNLINLYGVEIMILTQHNTINILKLFIIKRLQDYMFQQHYNLLIQTKFYIVSYKIRSQCHIISYYF
ncbi:Hypothetical_protein [Hexamita inflata]|uniref:Hypothetical_protein n=1 Tax=Hexamita inflata TaxID=28002 RepID=A0AA86UMF5_9EUKA|nr:Hypothetical protein HINF_LOCUS48734 [Hexamita inflata]